MRSARALALARARRFVECHRRRSRPGWAGDRSGPGGRRAPWGWVPLAEGAGWRIGRLEVARGRPVPPHDHPGARGFLMVLRGRLRVRRYWLEEIPGRGGVVMLRRADDVLLRARGGSLIGPPGPNIHELEACSRRCVVLQLLRPPYRHGERSFYFPRPGSATAPGLVYADCLRPRPPSSRIGAGPGEAMI